MAEPPGAGKRPGRQPPWDKGAEPEPGSFGTWLRRQRELREISLRDVAERTKISLRYLEAMEEDRFDLLPAPVFAKGFLREYARYVGLSPDEVVNHWLAVQQAGERPEGDEEEESAGSSRRRLSRVLLLLALLALAALVAFLVYRQQHPAAAVPSAPVGAAPVLPAAPPPSSSQPAAVTSPRPEGASTTTAAALPAAPPANPAPPPAPETEAPPAPLEVNLDFSRECWVEALIDGKKRIAEQRVAGEALRLPAEQTVQLTLGDAGAAEVQVNGTPLPLPVTGKGQVLKDFTIDLDTLKTLKARKEPR
ncbi:MAG TPA: helix-turn-helix domain-containing protein [Thermoanaerobaculia bacterium]|nr:helix-turn-helix domain-containing protein [Thermoanaerobaculia bacterium]